MGLGSRLLLFLPIETSTRVGAASSFSSFVIVTPLFFLIIFWSFSGHLISIGGRGRSLLSHIFPSLSFFLSYILLSFYSSSDGISC